MNVNLPWGKEFLKITLPDTWKIHIGERNTTPTVSKESEEDIVQHALNKPFGTTPLSSRSLSKKRILIVIDDNTRPTPVHRFLHIILEQCISAGADLKLMHIMPALGIHTPMNEAEMEKKIGKNNLKQLTWSNHNAFDIKDHYNFGTTRYGTPLILNKKLAECDLAIIVGMIEPHLWAGFGGGLKNIFPGLAAAKAIGIHHGSIARPPYTFNRVGMSPHENTFRIDLEELKGFLHTELFLLNVLLDENQRISAAFAGDSIEAHRKGVEACVKASGIKIDKPVDGVIVNSYPMEINFKQSMKCVANSLPALSPGGVIMGFLKAERGLDDISIPQKPPPLPVLKAILKLIGKSNVIHFLNIIKKNLKVEEKFLVYYTLRLIREYKLFLYTPTLSKKEIKHLGFFYNCETPQTVIDRAARKLKRNAEVVVFPEGGSTFPVIVKK